MNTKEAAAFAGLHPARLNEEVAAGIYRVAPETIPGRARDFGGEDVVLLCVYSDLLRAGLTRKRAGEAVESIKRDVLAGEQIVFFQMAPSCHLAIDTGSIRQAVKLRHG